jgi:hypothetical protein
LPSTCSNRCILESLPLVIMNRYIPILVLILEPNSNFRYSYLSLSHDPLLVVVSWDNKCVYAPWMGEENIWYIFSQHSPSLWCPQGITMFLSGHGQTSPPKRKNLLTVVWMYILRLAESSWIKKQVRLYLKFDLSGLLCIVSSPRSPCWP